jgi:hypothetical protein
MFERDSKKTAGKIKGVRYTIHSPHERRKQRMQSDAAKPRR